MRHVFVSDLRREFETPPYSRQVSLGSQVEMRCHPPKGKPTPTVAWLKNGAPVRQGGNLLVTGAGHLIVVKARRADAANYSCVAARLLCDTLRSESLRFLGVANSATRARRSNHNTLTQGRIEAKRPSSVKANITNQYLVQNT